MGLSNSAINRIGNVIRYRADKQGYDEDVKALNEWREAHGALMNEYYDKCMRLKLNDSMKNITVAQRLKRLPTIINKLNRFKTMRLSSVQDIAGVRIIARDMEQLSLIEKRIKRWKNYQRTRDYIDNPKADGYRSKHFIFKKDGMFVEIQLRTQVQHIWATSVETVDAFRNSSIKLGEDRSYWYDFFKLTSSAFAIAEMTKPIRGYEKESLGDICLLIEENMAKHRISQSLNIMDVAKRVSVDEHIVKDAYYLVLNLDFKKNVCHIYSFKESEYDLAAKKYQKLEQPLRQYSNTVLVVVSDIKKIDDTYPNYFLNLRFFNELIKYMLEKNRKKG